MHYVTGRTWVHGHAPEAEKIVLPAESQPTKRVLSRQKGKGFKLKSVKAPLTEEKGSTVWNHRKK